MIIKFKKNTTEEEFNKVIREIKRLGFKYDVLRDVKEEYPPVLGIKGDLSGVSTQNFKKFSGVIEVKRLSVRYKNASKEYKPYDTIIEISSDEVNKIKIGGENPTVFIAGPCAVESKEQIIRIAEEVKEIGVNMLRGGCWKPRTYARCFEGLKKEGLLYLSEASKKTKLPIVTEVTRVDLVELVSEYADVLQVGTRNMYNFDLLDELGKQNKPVLLKRGFNATIDEFLGAADRIIEGGNPNVILCLRGIRSFDNSQRYTADLYAIPDLRQKTHLPIVFDPSHTSGRRSLVPSLAKMAIVGGVDGLIIETHYNPEEAKCDGAQMITPKTLSEIINYAKKLERL